MMKPLLQDNWKKEAKIYLRFFCFCCTISLIALFMVINEETKVKICTLFFLLSCFGVYAYVYSLMYSIMITEKEIFVHTLFKQTIICLDDIICYSISKRKEGELYNCTLYLKNNKVIIYTRFQNELEAIFNKINCEKSLAEKSSVRKQKCNLNLVFGCAILSLPIAIIFIIIIGEVWIFGFSGLIRYSWIALFCIPIYFFALSKNNIHKRKLVIIYIMIPLTFLLGTARFTSRLQVYFDNSYILDVANIVNFGFPEELKIATLKPDEQTTIVYAKPLSEKEITEFVDEIIVSPYWTETFDSSILSSLPIVIQIEASRELDYMLLYNVSSGEYNRLSDYKTESLIFIGYSKRINKLVIIGYNTVKEA